MNGLMKSNGVLMALMAAAMAMPDGSPGQRFTPVVNPEQDRKRYLDVLKKKGVQEFNIDGKVVYARNYENALRKATKLKGVSKD